jgi:cytochrome c-type biogenesis protein CcmE
MSVDKELAQAVEEAEAESSVAAPAQAPSPSPAVAAPRKPKSNWALLGGLLVVVVGLLGLVYSLEGKDGKDGKGGGLSYALGVERLSKEQASFAKRSIKVTGMLVKGTLTRRDEPCEYRFKLHDKDNKDSVLPVAYPNCIVPDTFRDMPGMDVEVTAEGKLAADGKSFEATGIMAKCPSKYEMQQRSVAGEAAPHLGNQGSKVQSMADKI